MFLAALCFAATPLIAADTYSGNWGGSPDAPVSIEISDGKLTRVCNFGNCGAFRYTVSGDTYVLTNGAKRWTFQKAPGHPGYNAVYWENSGGTWSQVAGAKLSPQ